MKKDNLMYFTEIQFVEAQEIEKNPMISKVKVKIAYAGKNRNKFNISKEVLEEAASKTLGLTPIVALYNHYTGDFGEHGFQAVMDENGEYVTTADTQAIGVIPEKPEIFWEDNYLTTYGYLWTSRYKDTIKALEGRPQSMELSFEHTILEPSSDGYTKIVKTAFEGLCILGNDVTPAFEEASVEGYNFSLKEDDDAVTKDIDKLMEGLKFALENDFKTPLVVDVDGEERDKANREKVTEAIDVLDEAADLIQDEEARGKVDDAISQLVDAEVAMKKEADVIPVTEAARRGLQGQPGYKDGIVSTENLNYSKAQNSLLKKNEEEDKEEEEKVAKDLKKKEEEEVVVQPTEDSEEIKKEEVPTEEVTETKEEVKEEVPAEETVEAEPVAEEEEKIGSETEDTNSEGVPGGEEKASERAPEVNPSGAAQTETTEVGAEVQGGPQGPTADAISEGRKTAESKRTGALLSDVGDDELFDYLVERLEQQEAIKTRLQELLGGAIPEGLPEGGEVEIPDQASTPEEIGVGQTEDPSGANPEEPVVDEGTDSDLAAEAEVVSEENADVVQEDVVVETTEGGEAEEGAVAEEAPAQEESAPEEEKVKEEAPVEKDEDEEEKKKKAQFSLDFKAIIEENAQLNEKNRQLEDKVSELITFKAQIERKDKERVLLEFSLSDEAVAEITKDLDTLSIEEVEARAALTQHRETKARFGQKSKVSGIEFSLDTEESEYDPLAAALKAAKDKVHSNKY